MPRLCAGATGDPFYRFRLALEHNLIRSSELRHSVNLHAEPLFNPMFIAGWKPAVGIDIHWTINPILNLLGGLQAGPVYLAAIILAMFAGRRLRHRLAPWAVGAFAMFLALTYGLAVDPKARMFMLPLAAAAMVAAASPPARCRFAGAGSPPCRSPLAVASGLWVTARIAEYAQRRAGGAGAARPRGRAGRDRQLDARLADPGSADRPRAGGRRATRPIASR